MPYIQIPTKPPYRSPRWDTWGDAIDAAVRQLITDVPALTSQVGELEAGGGPANGRGVFVKPDSALTWPTQNRAAGDTLMWLRAWTDTVLAPIPTAADGYLPGDLVYPVSSSETLPGGSGSVGTLFSDTLNVTDVTPLDGRVGDAALGGSAPTWRGDVTGNASAGRVQVRPSTGLEMYSNAYAAVTSPMVPAAANMRFTFTVTDLPEGHIGGVVVRGTTYNSADTVRINIKSVSGALAGSIIDRSTGSTVTTQLGSAPITAGGTTVTISVVDGVVAVNVGGANALPYTIPAAAIRLPTFALFADWYSTLSVRDVKVEVI